MHHSPHDFYGLLGRDGNVQKKQSNLPCLILGEFEEDLELLEGEELPGALRRLCHDGRQDALPEGEHALRPVHLPHAVHDPTLRR